MKLSSKTFRPCSRGLTLLEVLASLAILATLMTGLLLAKGRAARQQVLAERRIEAVSAAESLMQRWWVHGTFPTTARGTVPGSPDLMWHVKIRQPDTRENKPYAVAQLQIVSASDHQVLSHVQWFIPSPSLRSPSLPGKNDNSANNSGTRFRGGTNSAPIKAAQSGGGAP